MEICEMYTLLYPTMDIQKISRFYREYKKCIINGEEYTSLHSCSQRSCAIAAKWRGVIGIDPRGDVPVRIGQVVSFIDLEIDVSLNVASVYHTTCSQSSFTLSHTPKYFSPTLHPRPVHIRELIGASVSEPPLVDSTDALSRYICHDVTIYTSGTSGTFTATAHARRYAQT